MSQNDKRDATEGVREIARVSLLVSGLSVAACVMGLSLATTYGATAAKLRVANAATAITPIPMKYMLERAPLNATS